MWALWGPFIVGCGNCTSSWLSGDVEAVGWGCLGSLAKEIDTLIDSEMGANLYYWTGVRGCDSD